MDIGKTLFAKNREQWRRWLAKNHLKEHDIWLIFHKKNRKKKIETEGVSFNDALEEALCFGWIDSLVKTLDESRYVQRFSPRKGKSFLSEINRELVKKLIKSKKMTPYGLESIKHHLENGN